MLSLRTAAFLVILVLAAPTCRSRPAETNEASVDPAPSTPCDATDLIDLTRVDVSLAYPGAGPSDVVDQVVAPVEAALASLPGLGTIRSEAREGLGTISAFFGSGVSPIDATERVRGALGAVDELLPPDVEPPLIFSVEEAHEAAIVLVLGDRTLRDLTSVADELATRLLAVPGIEWAEAYGAGDPQIVIRLDSDRAVAYGLLPSDVEEAVRYPNLDLPAGAIDVRGDSMLVPIAARSPSDDLDDVVIQTNAAGVPIRLGDVAEVERTEGEPDAIVRLDGQTAAAVMVGIGAAAPAAAGAGLDRTIAEMRTAYPADVRLEVISTTEARAIGVDIAVPPGTNVESLDRLVNDLGQRVAGVTGIAHVLSFSWVGLMSSGPLDTPSIDELGRLTLVLDQDAHPDAVLEDVRSEIGATPGANVRARHVGAQRLVIGLTGSEQEPLSALAERLVDSLRADPSVAHVRLTDATPQPEMRVEMDRERMAALGLTPQDITNEIRAATGPVEIGRWMEGGTEVAVVLETGRPARDATDLIGHLIRGRDPAGETVAVPLGELATIALDTAPAARHRLDAAPTVWIELDPTGDLDAVCQSWLELVEEQTSDAGVRYEHFVTTE